ncbi:hypothetical protein DDT91_02230 [Algoriphagus sp. AK58]|nr:hypothetical protein [Algoriphagus sp. AK58]
MNPLKIKQQGLPIKSMNKKSYQFQQIGKRKNGVCSKQIFRVSTDGKARFFQSIIPFLKNCFPF